MTASIRKAGKNITKGIATTPVTEVFINSVNIPGHKFSQDFASLGYGQLQQNTPHVVLRNRPAQSIARERLTCLNNSRGVQLGTLA